MENTSIKRDSNFELLRIIAMVMIIFSHLRQHGLWFSPDNQYVFNSILCESIFRHFGAIGNWLFIFISGYFISSSKISYKKIFRLWFQVFSISLIIGFAVWISGIQVSPHFDSATIENYTKNGFEKSARLMSKKDIIRCLFPCYFSNNWFVTAYMTFLLIVPLLNNFLNKSNREEHKHCIWVLIIIGTVIPIFPMEAFFLPSAVMSFIIGFFIAKYIKLYSPEFFNNKRRNFIISLLFYMFISFWIFICMIIFKHFSFGQKYFPYFTFMFAGMNTFTVMCCALFLFCGFRLVKITYNRFVNIVASATFGVYLIHENLLINKWWWHKICKLDDFVSSPFLIPYMFLCVLITFTICTILELLRKNIIERVLFHKLQ